MLNFLIFASMIFAIAYTLTAFAAFAHSEICNRHKKIIYDKYDSLKVKALKNIAKSRGLTRYSRLRKHDLILLLMA